MAPSLLHQRLEAVLAGRTVREVADLTRTHHEAVRRYLAGAAPSVEFLAAVCATLDVNGQWLLTGVGPVRVRDIKAAALTTANPAELMAAIAETLERLDDRLVRLERFVHTMETRLRVASTSTTSNGTHHAPNAHPKVDLPPTEHAHDRTALTTAPGDDADHARAPHDPRADPVRDGEPSAAPDIRQRARAIADAFAQRPRTDAH